jgi:drug/metabolite transporter (DMT)-like permease
MVAIVSFDLFPEAIAAGGLLLTSIGTALGAGLISLIDTVLPHTHANPEDRESSRFARTSLLLGIGVALHNLPEGLAIGAALSPAPWLAGALLLGLGAYGISLTLFVVALRHLGTARTGAYFSVAPFFGAALAVVWLGEPVTPGLLLAGALMAAGVWLHLTEKHAHAHAHRAEEHDHEHEHDVHHQHEHAEGPVAGRHSHPHRHEPLTHEHAHFPDAHHRHGH